VFENPEFRDDDPKMTEEIVVLMGEVSTKFTSFTRRRVVPVLISSRSQMQEHGAPPAEIMGELPPGLDLGPDGAPKLPDECVIG
jgi:peroxin-19